MMQINYTFRNLDSSNALKEYAREKIERVNRYLDKASEAHVVCYMERHHHICDITIHAGQFSMRGREKSEDFYASVDMAMDKIERQLKRYKEKLKQRRHGEHHHLLELEQIKVRHEVVAVASPDEPMTAAAAEPGHRVIKTNEFLAKPMTVDEAVMQMDLLNNDFLVFTNAGSREVNVVYRRKDGHYGLIEASAAPKVGAPQPAARS
jgi:putative sigma-54 modulation protein